MANTEEALENLFNNRDVEGNESEAPDTSSDEEFDPLSEPEDEEEAQKLDYQSVLCEKTKETLKFLDSIGFSPIGLLNGLSWGDSQCTQDATVRAARTSFLQDELLSVILRRWHSPPRSSFSNKSRPKGGRNITQKFAVETFRDIVIGEMKQLAKKMHLDPPDDIKRENLVDIGFDNLESDMKEAAPTLWEFLVTVISYRKRGKSEKDFSKIAASQIAVMSYTQSRNNCRFQKLLALYFYFKGVSAKGFDTLHALGLTMSHKWTADSVERISAASLEEVIAMMKIYPWLISYDNVNIPFRVFSQRLDNQGEFGNGTAGTVYIKPNAKVLPEGLNEELKRMRNEGIKNPLTELEIMDIGDAAFAHIAQFQEYEILRFLLDSPDFDLRTYTGKGSLELEPPSPIHQLASGPENTTLQYLLGTVNIAEASYEGNSNLIEEWFKQLGWGNCNAPRVSYVE